jgi:hypothetical protein
VGLDSQQCNPLRQVRGIQSGCQLGPLPPLMLWFAIHERNHFKDDSLLAEQSSMSPAAPLQLDALLICDSNRQPNVS